jgi:hypothetical protein
MYNNDMRIPGTRTFAILWAVAAVGCGDDVTVDTSMDTAETSGDGDGDGDGDEWEPIPARGDIALTHVVVNQGVDVAIAVDGVWVGPAERNTFVVGGRDTLLRGFWTIPDDWVPREITAVLELKYPDGTETSLTDTKLIEGPSFAGDLSRGFIFQLQAVQFPPGLEYHMTLWEAAPGAEEQRESTTIESPIGGLQLIGAQPEPAELKLVIMPVAYNDGDGCITNTATEITPEQEQRFVDYMHEQYPVQSVSLEFRRDTPIQWNEPLNSLSQLWAPLQDQRAAENAAPNVYFYALVNACVGGIDGAGGIAAGLPPDTKAAAFERTASGLWITDSDFGYETIVHEVGHLHGRAHVFCAGGDAAGVDPSYPYDDGVIGVWGFGIRLFQLHSPTATRDFMTYCMPTWVSDWGWSKAFNRVRTLTAWDYEGGSGGDPEPKDEVLIGLLFENGTEQWWTTQGAREPEHFSSGEVIEFTYEDAVIPSPTNVRVLDDGTTMITTMVPRPNVEFEAATRVSTPGQVRAIEM